MDRRDFMAGAAAGALLASVAEAAEPLASIPIIDSHIHLFDATRPQGAPYTGSRDFKGGVSLPAAYRALAAPLGIVGAVVMEASRWVEDNLWALQTAQTDTMMVGYIGDLQPEKSEFAEYLDRYRKNPLFRGIRYGNNWGYNIANEVDNPGFIDGLKRVADADLAFDVANPRIDLFQAVLTVNDRVPKLRIVLDHLPYFEPRPENQATYDGILKEFRGRPNISAKLSEIEHRANGELATGLEPYRARLDILRDVFGEDRVMFGTDYPQSVGSSTPERIVALNRTYFSDKPRGAAEKYFWKNSAQIYKWVKRAPNQPSLG